MMVAKRSDREAELWARAEALCSAATRRMQELRDAGGAWEEAWRTDPIAIEYRALLREVWAPPPTERP